MELVKEYYDSGLLRAEGLVKGNLKQRKWMFYFESGKIEMEIEYKNGIEEGQFKRWYTNGNLEVESFYVGGIIDGYWREYYEDGKIKEIGEYKSGEYIPIDFWDERGTQLLKNGTGKKIEKFGYLELDIFEQYFENGKFIKEAKISSARYGGFTPT
jgi:antitoxin component YwqK of YwqJK toxin-antitoxin module